MVSHHAAVSPTSSRRLGGRVPECCGGPYHPPRSSCQRYGAGAGHVPTVSDVCCRRGTPVSDTLAARAASPTGAVLVQDFQLSLRSFFAIMKELLCPPSQRVSVSIVPAWNVTSFCNSTPNASVNGS